MPARTPRHRGPWIGGGVSAAVFGLMAGGALATRFDGVPSMSGLELRVSAKAGSFALSFDGGCMA